MVGALTFFWDTLTVLPRWFYITLAVLGVTLAVWLMGDHAGTRRQAQKDAPLVAAKVTAEASTGLAQKQVTNTTTLSAATTAAQQKAQDHATAVQTAPTDDAAFRAYIDGLHDLQGRRSGPAGVPPGPKPTAAPPPTR